MWRKDGPTKSPGRNGAAPVAVMPEHLSSLSCSVDDEVHLVLECEAFENLRVDEVLDALQGSNNSRFYKVRGAQHEGAWDLCPLNGHLPGHPQPSIRATAHSPCHCHHIGSAAWASPHN